MREFNLFVNNKIKHFNVKKYVKKAINLSNLKYISNKAIKAIAKKCFALKSLHLEKCDQVTDESIN